MNKFTLSWLETSLASILVGLLLFYLNPGHVFGMTHAMEMAVAACFLLVFITLAALVLGERVSDEREESHRRHAGRIAFLSGACVLIAGFLWQMFYPPVDPWLPVALTVMVTAKVLSLGYLRARC